MARRSSQAAQAGICRCSRRTQALLQNHQRVVAQQAKDQVVLELKDAIDFRWRDDTHPGLLDALNDQRRNDDFVNAASRIALAILQLHRRNRALTINSIVAHVYRTMTPRRGWTTRGKNRFNQAEYEQRVWPVVAALKEKHPGEALIYIR